MSFVEPPEAAIVPLLGIAVITGIPCIWWARENPVRILWIPVLTLASFLLALSYSILAFVVAYGGSGGGWYLHSFAPLFGLLLGAGLVALSRWRRFRVPLLCLLLYPAVFLPGAFLYEALTYAGCGQKISSWMPLGSLSINGVHSPISCISNPSWTIDNLAVLGSPYAGFAS